MDDLAPAPTQQTSDEVGRTSGNEFRGAQEGHEEGAADALAGSRKTRNSRPNRNRNWNTSSTFWLEYE